MAGGRTRRGAARRRGRCVRAPAATEYEPPAAAEYGAVAAAAGVDAALGEDLKSRIEETRRRIREELEKPFAAVDQETPEITTPGPAPIAGAPAETPTPVIGEPISISPGPVDGGAASPAAAAAAAGGNGSDYDAMRARIELTRSRLKAKAFDAMMAGESALLGRDAEKSSSQARPAVNFDREIEQTVESTLREEEQ